MTWLDDKFLYACRIGQCKEVESFLKQGVNVNHSGNDGNTALHIACERVHTALVKLLLENDADANFRNSNNNTPLHKAVFRRSLDIVKVLVNAGAITVITNKDGRTPGWLAQHFKCNEIADYILNYKPVKEKLSETEQKIKKHSERVDTLEKECGALRQENVTLKNKLDNGKITTAELKVAELEINVDSLKLDWKNRFEEYKYEKVRLENNLQALTVECEQLRQENVSWKKRLEDAHNEFKQEFIDLRRLLKQVDCSTATEDSSSPTNIIFLMANDAE
jgi:ankyrin repeat protein